MSDTDLQAKVDQIIDQYGATPNNLLAVLQDVQAEFNYLPPDALKRVSKRMNVPMTRVSGLATFYAAFHLEPRGKHVCQVCMGTACHVRGAPRILDELERNLGIKAGETTADMQFSIETVNCVGACAMGPLVIVDQKYHGMMTPAGVDRMIKKLKKTN